MVNCVLIYWASGRYSIATTSTSDIDAPDSVIIEPLSAKGIEEAKLNEELSKSNVDDLLQSSNPSESIKSDNPIGNHLDVQIEAAVTAKAPPSDQMSSLADSHKRELSWSSPLGRRLSGDIDRRAEPNLYITDGERDIWFNNHFFIFEEHNAAFCVMEKNSCSMFKQIFKRIRGKADYLSTDYTKIHYLPYRGLEDISFNNIDKLRFEEHMFHPVNVALISQSFFVVGVCSQSDYE